MTENDRELERLRAAHPSWQIWYVHTAIPPSVWAAKRLGDKTSASLINEYSAEDLEKAITEAEEAHS